MAIIKCPECGHQVSDRAATCPSCGIEIAGHVEKCPHCGAVVFKGDDICPDCHHDLHPLPAAAAESHAQAVMPVEAAVEPAMPLAPATEATEAAPPTAGSPEPATPTRQPRKKSYIVMVVTVVILLIVGFIVYYMYDNTQKRSEQEAYELALKSGEMGALQNYLDIYADAPVAHRDSIQAHLEGLMQAEKEWADVMVSGSKVAIERYLQLHPGSPHEIEGRQRIDSLDWTAAEREATLEAYQQYISRHADGAYIDEARQRYEQLDAKQVTEADKAAMSQLFGTFFHALEANDDDEMATTLASVLDEFLTKVGATKNDVLTYMHKQHAAAWGTIAYTPTGDYKIEKEPAPEGEGTLYTVAFSVDEKRTDMEGKTTLSTLRVAAKVDALGKISTLKMQRLAE